MNLLAKAHMQNSCRFWKILRTTILCDSLLHFLHTVSVLYTSHGGYVHHMVDMYITWWICTSHGGYVRHMVDMYVTWWMCTSHGGYVHHMVDVYITWWICTSHVMYITWWLCTIASNEIFIDYSLTTLKELVPPLKYVINYDL